MILSKCKFISVTRCACNHCLFFSTTILEAHSESKEHVYFYKASRFTHFEYNYKLMMKCKNRIEEVQEKKLLSKDVFIQLVIVGSYTRENLQLISKGKGERCFK